MILASSKCVAYKAGFDSAIILCNVLTIIGIVLVPNIILTKFYLKGGWFGRLLHLIKKTFTCC